MVHTPTSFTPQHLLAAFCLTVSTPSLADSSLRFQPQPVSVNAAEQQLIGVPKRHGFGHYVAAAFACQPGAPKQPPRCPKLSGQLKVGGQVLHIGLYTTTHEHDGMYSINETIVLADTSGKMLVPVHGLLQRKQNVVDCYTHTLLQRQRTQDLNDDGQNELCIETVEEVGKGLFTVMDHRRWYPKRRERTLRAFRFEAQKGVLVRDSSLDKRCSRKGPYRLFAVPEYNASDSVAWRMGVQGGRVCGPLCAKRYIDACGNVHFEP